MNYEAKRCESDLQPGYNLTVRIEKNTTKTRHRRKKHCNPPQNYVVYRCHFCAHRNLKRGTPGHHMRTICPSKPKSFVKPDKVDEGMIGNIEANWMDDIASVSLDPSTLLIRTSMTLSEAKSQKRTRTRKKKIQCKSNDVKINEENFVGTLCKQKRKSWTSLKELAESSENDYSQELANFTIPFVM